MPVTTKTINLHEAVNHKTINEGRVNGLFEGARDLVDGGYPELQLVMLVGEESKKVYGSALVVYEYASTDGDRVISDVCLLSKDGKMRILKNLKEDEIENALKTYIPDWHKEDLK